MIAELVRSIINVYKKYIRRIDLQNQSLMKLVTHQRLSTIKKKNNKALQHLDEYCFEY